MNVFDGEWPYPSTHTIPSVPRWGTEFRVNWLQSRKHVSALNQELQEQFARSEDPASWQVIQRIAPGTIELTGLDLTPRPQPMLEQYRIRGDSVRAYRDHYAGEKAGRATYYDTQKPPWFP